MLSLGCGPIVVTALLALESAKAKLFEGLNWVESLGILSELRPNHLLNLFGSHALDGGVNIFVVNLVSHL